MKLNQFIAFVITLPLIFTLAVCGTVFFQLFQVEKQFSNQQRLSQALAACQGYISLMIRAGATLSKLGNEKSASRFTGYRDHFKEIEEGNAQLKRIAVLVPSEKAAVDSILATDDEFHSLAKELMSLANEHKGKSRDSRSLTAAYEMIDHTRKRFSILKDIQSRLLNKYKETAAAQEVPPFDIFSFVIYSSCVAAVLTFFAAFIVQRLIINRLSLLSFNTRAFLRNERPVPLSGVDEIASVDRAMHSMIDETAEILKRERAVIDRTQAAIFSVDENFVLQTASPSCRTLWTAGEEFIGLKLADLLTEQNWKIASRQMEKSKQEGQSTNFSLSFYPEETGEIKRTYFCSTAWNPLEKRYFCTFTDISESESKRDEIRSREEKIRTIMELMPTALLLLDEKGRIQLCNASALQLLSASTADLTGRCISEFLSLQSAGADVSSYLQFCKAKLSETTILSTSGESIHIQMTVDNFDSTSWLLVLSDVNERYKLEEARQNIVSVIAHDIRTPLTSMLANLDLMILMGKAQPEISQSEEIHETRKTCRTLTMLINELLTIQRFGQPGAAVQSFKTCLLNDFLDESIEAVSEMSILKGIEVQSECADESATLDTERTQQCIVKLLKLLIATHDKGSNISMQARVSMRAVENILVIDWQVKMGTGETISLHNFLNSQLKQADEAVEVSVLLALTRNIGAILKADGELLSLQIPILRSILYETPSLPT